MVVDLGFFDALGIEGSRNVEGIVEICYFAYRVFEATDLDEFFHPNRLGFLENGKQRIFGHI